MVTPINYGPCVLGHPASDARTVTDIDGDIRDSVTVSHGSAPVATLGDYIASKSPEGVDKASVKQDPQRDANLPEYHAYNILGKAAQTIGSRATERDLKEERSMKACVDAFNGLYGTTITEEQGWAFMILLKLARAKGKVVFDSYLDAVSYCALMAESAMKKESCG